MAYLHGSLIKLSFSLALAPIRTNDIHMQHDRYLRTIMRYKFIRVDQLVFLYYSKCHRLQKIVETDENEDLQLHFIYFTLVKDGSK